MKPRDERRLRGACTALVLACLPACSAILGIEDGVPEEAGASPIDGTTQLRDAGAVDAKRVDATQRDTGGNQTPDVSVASLDSSTVIYVVPDGALSAPCGERTNPCASVILGIASAQAAADGGSAYVLVAQGTYHGTLTLASRVSIKGGFLPGWDASVPSSEDAGTIIVGVGPMTVVGQNLTGSLALVNLTLLSGVSPAAGESVYGVFLTNDGGVTQGGVVLQDLIVVSGDAGSGPPGTVGDAGMMGPDSCTSGGTGGAGGMGGPAGPMSCSVTGCTTGSGQPGRSGGMGAVGDPGKPKCAIGAGDTCVDFGVCSTNLSSPCTSGLGGCGGGGGGGGAGGGGGGSSIALYFWNVPVTVSGGTFVAGNGGNGGLGGAGGEGGPGGEPPQPATITAIATCGRIDGSTCGPTGTESVTGGIGAVGHPGGAGGAGASGGGGSSYALFWGLQPPGGIAPAQLFHGNAGTGSVNGVAAQSGMVVAQ